MLHELTEAEKSLLSNRVHDLFASVWIIDNLTAILMDPKTGDFGLHEEIARAKANRIIRWLETIADCKIPPVHTLREKQNAGKNTA